MMDHWGWRAMMISEGALPFVWLAVWLICIKDHPSDAKWLRPAERDTLVATLRRESDELERAQAVPFLRALFQPRVFALIAVYFCYVSGQMGLLFWLPSAMGNFKGLSNLSTGILYTLPFIVGCIALVVVGRLSDRHRERPHHIATALLIGGTCILLAVAVVPYSLVLAFVLISLSGIGAYGPLGPFWSIPTETLPAKVVGSVMGLVNALGNLGAYCAPLIVGYLNKKTGNFYSGFAFLGGITLVGAALALLLRGAEPLRQTQILSTPQTTSAAGEPVR
jgi:sugar phosphate permease